MNDIHTAEPRNRKDASWRSLYIRALAQMSSLSLTPPERHRIARFVADRLAIMTWKQACRWQAEFGDPNHPGKVHPRLAELY